MNLLSSILYEFFIIGAVLVCLFVGLLLWLEVKYDCIQGEQDE